LNPKFAIGLAAIAVRTSGSRHQIEMTFLPIFFLEHDLSKAAIARITYGPGFFGIKL